MTEIISYRLSATGVWGYSYYLDRTPVGTTGCEIGRVSTVRIAGENVEWFSQFSIDTDVFPGVSRKVRDQYTGEELYRIIYWQPGFYMISARMENGEWTMSVEERNGAYWFCRRGMPVAAVTERLAEAEWSPKSGMRIEPAFRTTFYELEDNPGFRMMVLSFPALRII